MFQGKNKLKGLTLIELVVAVGISVLLIAVSIPLFTKEKGTDRTRSQAELVASFIDKARNLAVHPESEKATAYRVKFSSKAINIIRLGTDGGESVPAIDSLNFTGYQIVNILQPTADFNVFSGEYKGAEIRITVQSDTDSNKSFITISSPGVINVL